MSQNPFTPTAALLCKLGSIAVHVEEMLSSDGHAFDRAALFSLLGDSEVQIWLALMEAQGMVPRKRLVGKVAEVVNELRVTARTAGRKGIKRR